MSDHIHAEQMSAGAVKVGQRVRPPTSNRFETLTAVERSEGGSEVTLGTGWGTVTLNIGDTVLVEDEAPVAVFACEIGGEASAFYNMDAWLDKVAESVRNSYAADDGPRSAILAWSVDIPQAIAEKDHRQDGEAEWGEHALAYVMAHCTPERP